MTLTLPRRLRLKRRSQRHALKVLIARIRLFATRCRIKECHGYFRLIPPNLRLPLIASYEGTMRCARYAVADIAKDRRGVFERANSAILQDTSRRRDTIPYTDDRYAKCDIAMG